MIKLAVICRNNLILGLDHVGVDKTLNAIPQDIGLIYRLHAGLRNFQHDGPVWAFFRFTTRRLLAISEGKGGQLDVGLGLIVRRIVGENGGSVERAVVFREVKLSIR